MRKTLIALILVLPMAFVLVVFSSVNAVSLGVNIAVNGIKIYSEGANEEGTLVLDMADRAEHTVKAEVTPSNATEKGYTLTSSDPAVVDVTKEGVIQPKREGTVSITATSNDKSFTASMPVVVVSSKPYDLTFTLCDEAGTPLTDADGEPLLKETEAGYEATVPAGRYTYGMAVEPVEFAQYTIARESGPYAEIERGARSIFLPFSGDAEFSVTVPDGVRGDIRKEVLLHVTNPASGGALINGSAEFKGTQLAFGTTETQLFVECAGGKPSFSSDHATLKGITSAAAGQYILDIEIEQDAGEEVAATISARGKQYRFLFSFSEFAFTVTSDRTIETEDNGGKKVTILTGSPASFYAVASSGAKGVEYLWEFTGPAEYFSEDGSSATVDAKKGGEYILRVTARYGDNTLTQELVLFVINKVSVVQIANNAEVDLAANYTIAGMVYTDELTTAENVFPLTVYTYSTVGIGFADEDIVYTVSDDSVATVEPRNGAPVLIPRGTGEVTVVAAWKYNAEFKSSAIGEITFNVVKDAVAVKNSPELVKATEERRPVVLTENIKLGTDAAGNDFTRDQLEAFLKDRRMKSTYNIEWYKNSADAKESDAWVSYVLEFTNDVYGNGKYIKADNFTHCHDANHTPLLRSYAGPLYFVKYKQMASVAGQDNCAFLLRTDGVKLYGVQLYGYRGSEGEQDRENMSEEEQYDLSDLNLTGTTLEVNASCEIVNCRIGNGRNVVRVYGGNRDGSKYFIDSLSENNAGVDSQRINVTFDGCILSQGREFILKVGANRALRASKAGGPEPELRDQSGKAYSETGKTNRYADGKLYEDPWFYKHYVMTDVTVKDCLIETSGLFTVGIESNFAGQYLFEGGDSFKGLTTDWEKSGGTSFASVLRLEGETHLHDWKDLSLVDSSTLIEAPAGVLKDWLKLDISAMLDFVTSPRNPSYRPEYKQVIETTSDGKQYVHGGVALYGGGRNYSAVVKDGLSGTLGNFLYLNVNISILKGGSGNMQQQGELLPNAAGTHDFNFYMYSSTDAKNNYAAQKNLKYRPAAVPLFAE